MAYGTVKVDNITFDNGGSDQNVTVSGLYRATTSGVTVTGTISGAVLVGTTTVSGATVTGTIVQGTTVQGVSGTFTSLTGITTSGTTANFVSGVFTTQVSGTTITGTTSSFTSGNFATLSGATATFTSGVIASGTAANPSLSILGDPNTGAYSPGADQLGIVTNGVERIKFGSTEVVINDGGTDYDLRIEGDTNSTLFCVDASTDRVGIGTSSPTTILDVNGDVKATGIFSSAAGTAAAPSIAFTGDPNTGIYSPGADQLAISTNGTGRLFVAADGKVGVGTSTPNGLLTVAVATAGTAADFVIGNPANLWSIKTGTTTNALIIVDTQFSAERLRITSAGNVGIGTSSPISNVQVVVDGTGTENGSMFTLATGGGNLVNKLNMGVSSASNYAWIQSVKPGTNVYPLILNPAGGNVGIGTTSPGQKLHVSGGDTTNVGFNGTTKGVRFDFDGTQASIFGVDNTFFASYQPLRIGGSITQFMYGGVEAARIDSSGRLLVGTSSASGGYLNNNSLVHVQAEGASAGITIHRPTSFAALAAPYLVFSRSRGTPAVIVNSGDNLGSIEWGGADGTDVESTAALIRAEVDGTPGANDMPGRLVFSTTADGAASPTERMRINSAGNVGIGTSAPGARLQINAPSTGRSYSSSVLDFSNIHLEGATANTTTSALTFSSGGGGGAAIAFSRDSNIGTEISLWTNSAGGADAATQRMTVTSAGNVGIGTTSPGSILTLNDPGTGLSFVNAASGNYNIGLLGGTGSADAYVFNRANSPLILGTNNAERARIDSSGNVGIGTSAPNARLHVADGQIKVANSGAINPTIIFTGSSAGASGFQVGQRYNAQELFIYDTAALVDRVIVDSSGRVGIGTTSPSSLLHLADAGHITVGTTTGTKIGTATTQKLGFYNATPVVQPTAVADATDAATAITQLNALLTRMRNLGLIAT